MEVIRARSSRGKNFISELGNRICKGTKMPEYRHLFLWDHQKEFCIVNSRYGRSFAISPFGLGVRGVPRPRYEGIPRGLDEIDLELKSRLARNTQRIRNSIRRCLAAGDFDDARKTLLNFYWLKLGAHELLFDRIQYGRDRKGKIAKGQWYVEKTRKLEDAHRYSQ